MNELRPKHSFDNKNTNTFLERVISAQDQNPDDQVLDPQQVKSVAKPSPLKFPKKPKNLHGKIFDKMPGKQAFVIDIDFADYKP